MKHEIIEKLEKTIEKLYPDLPDGLSIELERPGIESHGDLSSNIALRLAKSLQQSPLKIGEDILSELKLSNKVVVELVPPGFINFRLPSEYYIDNLEKILSSKNDFGRIKLSEPPHWVIEHTSPNPNKAMHLGHIRNNLIGMSLANLWGAIGIKVTTDAVDNNRGIAIAKLMWGYLKFARKNTEATPDINYWIDHQDEWYTPDELDIRPDRFVDGLYSKASQDFENDISIEMKVRQFVVDWEQGDSNTWELWSRVLEYSHTGQNMTLSRLDNRWDKVWHEHEHYKEGKELVLEGLKRGLFRRTEDGAILTNLKKYGITDTVLIKSDGTSLYITQDIALTKLKKETFKADKLFWVIGPEQSLALKQLFAVCDQLGIGHYYDFTHITYGWMSLKGQGKMSSRKGNVIYIDELFDEAERRVSDRLKDRNDLSEQERVEIARVVGMGAVKYSVLKVGRTTDIAFDYDSSLAMEGDSAPYLLYSYARAYSILSSPKINKELRYVKTEMHDLETTLLRWLERYPEIVEQAAKNYAPNLVCNYLFELAQRFNSFYRELSVLGSPEEVLRLKLTSATAQVLANGLQLLGIHTVNKM